MTAPRILFDPARGARHARPRAGTSLSPAQRSAAAGAVVALALIPTGAYGQAADPQPEPLVAGETVQVGPFEVTIRQVTLIPELGYLVQPEGGNRVLAVVADVTNTSDLPEVGATLTDALPAPTDGGVAATATTRVDEEGSPLPSLVRAVDGTDPSPFSPGLTHRVVLAWEQEAGWDGSTVTLEIDGVEWIEKGALRLDNGFWLETGGVAHSGVFPVEVPAQGPQVQP